MINLIFFAVYGVEVYYEYVCSIQAFLPYSLKNYQDWSINHLCLDSRRDLNILGQICIKRFGFLRAKAMESDIIVNFALVDFPFLRYNQKGLFHYDDTFEPSVFSYVRQYI